MLDDGDKAISYDCRANLYSDSVLCSAPEFLNLEVLLEPLEEQLNLPSVKKDGSESGTNTTRVGRWMSQDEYNKMVASGKVQMSGDNKVHVANPADINAFGKQAPKGSIYVEFDVPSNTISKGGTDGWGIINGPGSLLDRLNAKKGLPRITEMPNATNITIGEYK